MAGLPMGYDGIDKKRNPSRARGVVRGGTFFLLLGFLFILGVGLYAATTTETFTTPSDYILSDPQRIEVAGGVARLKLQNPFYLHDSKPEFDAGTYSDMELHPGDVGPNQSAVKTSDSGLMAYWKFNERGGTTAADSKGAHTGTLLNGPTWDTGRFGKGVRFDGLNDSVSVLDSIPLSPTAAGW